MPKTPASTSKPAQKRTTKPKAPAKKKAPAKDLNKTPAKPAPKPKKTPSKKKAPTKDLNKVPKDPIPKSSKEVPAPTPRPGTENCPKPCDHCDCQCVEDFGHKNAHDCGSTPHHPSDPATVPTLKSDSVNQHDIDNTVSLGYMAVERDGEDRALETTIYTSKLKSKDFGASLSIKSESPKTVGLLIRHEEPSLGDEYPMSLLPTSNFDEDNPTHFEIVAIQLKNPTKTATIHITGHETILDLLHGNRRVFRLQRLGSSRTQTKLSTD